ncbi:MAG TPA: ion transporter [Methylomirabilota bacterium]|nr:ion transporter [Methylomirabilota bacterium]
MTIPAERLTSRSGWRARLHEIIFESDTRAGRAFDLALLTLILVSVTAVVLESVAEIRREHGTLIEAVEWTITALFTVEYILRLVAVDRPGRYARSFYGVVDVLAIAPTYLALVLPEARSLMVIRAIRLLRVFRILKLAHFLGEAQQLLRALRASRRKIIVFLVAVATSVVIMGTLMYLIEGETHGFTSIPVSMYWAVVTMTTVGYGDIAPRTPLGQFLASVLMILGYGIIAVPTGIVSVELARTTRGTSRQACPGCSAEGHDEDATHCKYCGAAL